MSQNYIQVRIIYSECGNCYPQAGTIRIKCQVASIMVFILMFSIKIRSMGFGRVRPHRIGSLDAKYF